MNPRERKYYEHGWRHGRQHGTAAVGAAQLRQSLAAWMETTEEEAVHIVVTDYQRRLDATPSLMKYPELKGMRECVLAHDRGVAEGADVSLDDVMLRANYLHAIHSNLVAGSAAMPSHADCGPGCTLVYFPRGDRGRLLANNNDGTARWAHRNPPEWIVANRAGLIVGTVSSGIFDDEVSPEQFPAPVFLMAYELCGTASEAVDLLTRLNLFWGPCNTLLADRHGNSAIIEKSTCRYGVRKSNDGFSATTEMSAEEPAFKQYLWETRERSVQKRGIGHDCADWAYWKACEKRSERLLRLTAEASNQPSYAKIERIIYDHTGEPEQVHMDGTTCHPDQTEAEWSLRTTIWMLDERRAIYSFAEPPVSGHLTPRHELKYSAPDPVF